MASASPSGSQEIEITRIFAKGEHIPMNEVTSKLIKKTEPGTASNKWLHPSRDSWIEAEFGGPYIVKSYILQSANNVPERDPLEWRLIGKTVSGSWVPLAQERGIFERRHLKREYPVEVNTPVIAVRLIIDKNNGDAYTQLARIKFMGNPYLPLFTKINNSRPAGTGIYEPKLGKINSSIKEPSLQINENLNPLPARSGLDAIRYLHEDTNVGKLKPKKDISKSVNNWNKIISTKLENMKTSGWTNPKTGKPPTRMNAIVETSKWKLENYEGGSRKQKATRKRLRRARKTRRS